VSPPPGRARRRPALKERGTPALRGPAIALWRLIAVAGLLLVLLPGMDHWWLGWLEASVAGRADNRF
jgi:hypothetical protein